MCAKIKTGFGTGGWQLAALNICSKAARKPLIADGGIERMATSLSQLDLVHQWSWLVHYLRHTKESPGETVELDGKTV